ncbi:hypothetical protein Tco_0077410 [Tanacetum coccineum]
MANQEQNPPQQEQPFVAAKQVGFNLEDIILNTNNEVALLYPEHTNKDFFKCVSDFISKCCLREPFTRSPNMYKEYLAEFWYSSKSLINSKVSFLIPTGCIYGEVGVNTFRNAIGVHYLPHSSEYVAPPSIDIVRKWFESIGYGETVSVKGTLKKSLLPPRWSLANEINIDYASIFWEDIIIKLNKKQREKVVPYTRFISLLIMHKMKEGYGDGDVTLYPTQVFSVNNWALKPNQPEEPPFTDHMLAICSAAKPVVFKAPKLSSNAKRVSQGTKPRAQPGYKKHSTSSKQPFVSSREATKGGSSKAPTGSKTGHLKKKKDSCSTMESNPSQTSVFTPVVTEIHKEDQQATGGLNFLWSLVKKEQTLSSVVVWYDASANSTVEADLGKSAPNKGAINIAKQIKEVEASSTIKLEDLAKLVQSVQPSFKDLDSPEDDHIIVVDDSDKDEEVDKDGLHVTSNIETEDDSVPKSSSPRTKLKLKLLSLKLNPPFLMRDNSMKIKLPGDSKEIPTKLEDFRKTVTSLTSQVTELKTLQWELPADLLYVPTQVEMVQAKLKTLDALPSLLNKVTNDLNQFAQAIASKKTEDTSIPSAGQASTQPAKEKNTNQTTHWIHHVCYQVHKARCGICSKLGQSISTESRKAPLGFCDASWQCDKDDTKSQTGYVFVVNGGAVDWKSKKQTTIAMHATQSEYMAASEAAMEAVWIRKFVGDLGVMPSINKPINMYCDNSAAITFANEPGVMKGARHFLRRYHYVREQVESGEIKLIKVHTDKNLADAFTKALPRGKVNEHANGIGLRLASSFMHICD